MQENQTNEIVEYRKQVKEIVSDKTTINALAKHTFEGLEPENIPQALMEGMMKGFTPEDFFIGNVYALPFWNSQENRQDYSLVTSIDYARKIAAKSGMSGKSAPKFTEDDNGELESCSVTVWKDGGDKRGYTATVYFDEYVRTNKSGDPTRIWKTKPRTMLAKVAEMHALRMAAPEELQNHYSSEEMEKEHVVLSEDDVEVGLSEKTREEIEAIETMEDLKKYHKENGGQGREFDKLIVKKKKELTEKENEDS